MSARLAAMNARTQSLKASRIAQAAAHQPSRPPGRLLAWLVALLLAVCLSQAAWAADPTPEQDFDAGYKALTQPPPGPDHTLAARHLLRAAKAGHQGAQALSGYLYLRGLGLPKNPHWAAYWLTQALAHKTISDQERAMAQTWLDEASAAAAR